MPSSGGRCQVLWLANHSRCEKVYDFYKLTSGMSFNALPALLVPWSSWAHSLIYILSLTLTISLVYCPGNGKTISEITIQASDIRDLWEANEENVATKSNFPPPSAPRDRSTSRPSPKTFEDPAIVSMGRPPISRTPTMAGTSPIHAPVPVLASRKVSVAPHIPSLHPPRRPSSIRGQTPERKVTPAAVLVDPMENLEIENENGGRVANGSEAEVLAKERNRRRRGRGPRTRKAKVMDATDGDEVLPVVTPVTQTNPAKGWRQTPLLEPNPSFQPFAILKRKAKAGKTYDNGWATEDATDVQDMGDFDFQASLSKFDKRTVFEGIRADDITADEDRLVGHNRLPKPGTMGGRNLHPTENVLDMEPTWNSEAGDSDDVRAVSQRGSGSGRTSRRAESRLRVTTAKKDPSLHSSQTRQPTSAPRSKSQARDIKPAPAAQMNRSAFYLVPADRRVEVASALQMLNLENIANSELGLTEDMMTENAARGIAEVALSALNPGGRRLTQGSAITLPYVVIYAGNNKSGIRAIAAGRHLRNHGATVVVCVLGLEREPELLEGLRRQLKVFRSFGGKVFTKVELKDYIKSMDVPVELIIDGLLGLTISFEELRTGDQATAYELIEMANRSKAAVLAVDIPTGLDPSLGTPMTVDGRELWIRPSFVVSMGVPKTGLLETMRMGHGTVDGEGERGGQPWQLFVADIGIAKNVWKKSGMRMRRGVEFEGTWLLGMRFQKGAD